MPKYNTHAFVENYYKSYGYILKSNYKNNKNKDSLICPKNHNPYISFGNFQQGYRCSECSTKTEKLTHEYVLNYYKTYDYILTSIYTKNSKVDDLICPIGHKIKISFGNFQQGIRCRECYFLRRRCTQESVKEYYKKYGYILKTEYKGNKNKDTIICPFNHEIKITYDSFKRGTRCIECYHQNNYAENHPRWNRDRTIYKRSEQLRFNHRKIKILSNDPNYNNLLNNKNLAKIYKTNHQGIRNIYEIDHIFPRKSFIDNDLDNIYDPLLIKNICNLRENLQIIHRTDNQSKSGKYNQEEFMNWFNSKLKGMLK